jgi:hypothetical protein
LQRIRVHVSCITTVLSCDSSTPVPRFIVLPNKLYVLSLNWTNQPQIRNLLWIIHLSDSRYMYTVHYALESQQFLITNLNQNQFKSLLFLNHESHQTYITLVYSISGYLSQRLIFESNQRGGWLL